MLNWNLIPQFLKVYELNSISKAADALDLSQPAMSLSIKRLEETLNKQLFIRSGRKLTSTADAHELANHFGKMLEHYDRAITKNRQWVISTHDSLTIYLSELENTMMLEGDDDYDQILDDIRENKVDLAIDFVETTDPSFVCETIMTDRMLLACRADHPTVGDSITMEEYMNLDHAVMHLKRYNAKALEFLSGLKLERRVVKSVTSTSNLLLAVRNTDAVCGCLETMVPLAKLLGLKVIKLPYETRELKYNMIYHRRMSSNKRHLEYRDYLKSKLRSL